MKSLKCKPGAERTGRLHDRISTLTVDSETPLMEFLMMAIPGVKRTTVKELLAHNQVKVGDNVVRQFDHLLTPGQTIAINYTREWRTFRHHRMRLVYEDDDIIVVEKGYGLLSMGTDKVKEGTAYSILREWVKWENPANKLFIIHRLDRDTSGLMMFAKNERAKDIMQHNWNNMVLNRKYLAIVEGIPEPENGQVKSYLCENSKFEVYSSPVEVAGSKLAVTRYRRIRSAHGYTMLEVELDTGRKNQIRVHMKDLGTPIAGDRKYGAKSSPIHRLALHAMTLRFVHPITRKEMNFSTPVPPPFARMVGKR